MAAQGRESSQDEKGASALLAVALDDEYGGRPVQVRPFSSTFDTQIEQNRCTFVDGCWSFPLVDERQAQDKIREAWLVVKLVLFCTHAIGAGGAGEGAGPHGGDLQRCDKCNQQLSVSFGRVIIVFCLGSL